MKLYRILMKYGTQNTDPNYDDSNMTSI